MGATVTWLRLTMRQQTLTLEQIVWAFAASVVFFLCVFFTAYAYDDEMKEVVDKKTGEKKMVPKKKIMTWAISVAQSTIMTVLGSIYVLLRYTDPLYEGTGTYIPSLPPIGSAAVHAYPAGPLYSADDFGCLICVIFGVANILDLGLGLIYYPEALSFLTTYFHHGVMIWLMLCCTTTIGGSPSLPSPFVPSFVLALPEELPTMLMGLGSINPKWRTDLWFGVTFFLLRVCYHMYLCFYVIANRAYNEVIGVLLLTMTLHVFWFKSWIAGPGWPYVAFLFPWSSKNSKKKN
jgi:hypothetical protein